jgi:N-methylhydantoinase A
VEYLIGVDTGGTFTDVVVIDGDGVTWSGKSPTTPSDLAEGLIGSVADAAQTMSITLEELLAHTRVFRYSGTTATNALLTYAGVPTGVITTKGFEDTLHVGRAMSAWAGLTEEEIRRAYQQRKPKSLVSKRLVRGVAERIDYAGHEIVSLDAEGVQRAADELVSEGVRSIAVCFMWSVRNDAHERAARELILAGHPQLAVHCSCEVAPAVGEFERFMTAVADAYVGPVLAGFIAKLDERLREKGFDGQLLIAQADGGALYPRETRPVYTLQSGPAGGVIAAAGEGKRLGMENVITTDVGGTSFDVGLVADGAWIRARDPVIGRLRLSLPMIEVESIGAGGGSLAWADELGVLHVGPKSAGAYPGPAAYGRGGTSPTVTDADVVLGYLNPDYFLDGKMKLFPDKAREVLSALGDRIGLDAVGAAAGIFEIANNHMAGLIRRRVLSRGYDPRDFTVFSYGGAGAIHAAFYGAESGVSEVIVPALAGTFSALGVATAPLIHSARRTEFTAMPMKAEEFDGALEDLRERVTARLEADGVDEPDRSVVYSVDMRYGSQVHTVRLELPVAEYDEEAVGEVCAKFDETYERLFGKGSAFSDAGRFLTGFTVEGYGRLPVPVRPARASNGASADRALSGVRDAYFDGDYVPTNVYRYDRLASGTTLVTPAIVEAPQTTVVVPPGRTARVDEYLNIRIGGFNRHGER